MAIPVTASRYAALILNAAVTNGSLINALDKNKALEREAIRVAGAIGDSLLMGLVRQKLLYAGVRNGIPPRPAIPNKYIYYPGELTQQYARLQRDPNALGNKDTQNLPPPLDWKQPNNGVRNLIYFSRLDGEHIDPNFITGNNGFLYIPFVPYEVDMDPSANWVTIPTIGRNNPFYQYTGGEDVLTFTVDWSAKDFSDKSVQSVIKSCRLMEALTRNDGYNNQPPQIILGFGDLYTDSTWILTAAPYKMSLFEPGKKLLPRVAYQEITLRRVVDENRTWSDIIGVQ